MYYTKIPELAISASKLGFGTWGLGGDAYGAIDKSVALKALEFAYESGINFFDTADIYGDGKVEELLGNVFRNKRHSVIISSKVGYLRYPSKSQKFDKKFIRNQLEASLKRLNSDYIDIYHLHSPPADVLLDKNVIDFLFKLKDEGKIKKIGVSVRSVSDGLIAVAEQGIDVIQVIFNILDQRAVEHGLTHKINALEKTMISRVPLCFGLITGKYQLNPKFGDNDHRGRWGEKQLNKWINSAKIFERYFSELNNYTIGQNALKFSVTPFCNLITIPGMKSIEQVRQNLFAMEIKDYNADVLDELFSLYKKYDCLP